MKFTFKKDIKSEVVKRTKNGKAAGSKNYTTHRTNMQKAFQGKESY